MTDTVAIALLVAIPLVLGHVVQIILALKGVEQSRRNADKIDAVHDIANSLSDKREAAATRAGRAEGVLSEKAAQAVRDDSKPPSP